MDEDAVADDPTDEGLFREVQAGRTRALGVLFDRHYDGAFRLASRLLGDGQAAADAVQEAFLRVIRYRHGFRGRGSFRSWLLSVVRNACLDQTAARRRERDALKHLPPLPATGPPELPDERLPLLRDALEALLPSRREALVLRRFHGCSYAEIADICGISEGAARVRVHRALGDLRRILLSSPETPHDT